MTLEELSKCYEDSAVLLRKRLHELRKALAASQNPEEVWHIKRRIADLTPMLTQMDELAWMLQHYYERGGAVRDDRYGFNGIRKPPKKWQANETISSDIAKRINRFTKANICGISLSSKDHGTDCNAKGCEQEHHLQNLEAGRNESQEICEVFPDVSQFFLGTPNRHKRRNT